MRTPALSRDRARGGAALVVIGLLLGGCSKEPEPPAAVTPPPTAIAAPAPDAEKIYTEWCAPCHAAGPGHPGTFALAQRLGAEKAVLLERDDLVAAYVTAIVRNGLNMMPPFRATEISDAELAALATYVATASQAQKR